MHIAIIGSGIAGLSAAFYLTEFQETAITIYERAAVFGGRAGVTDGGEHCARIFLDDYKYLFSIFRRLEYQDERSVYDVLQEADRYCYADKRGWVRVSHLYAILAKELSVLEKIELAREARKSPLLGKHSFGADRNVYSLIRHISAISLMRVAFSILRARTVYAFEGSTDDYLITPWVNYLAKRGVLFKGECRVLGIASQGEEIAVRSSIGAELFDAVIIATHLSDTIELIAKSVAAPHRGGGHHLDTLQWKCVTFTLDAREKILAAERPAIYSKDGINILLQPNARRCVVLCIRSQNTEKAYIVHRAREFLGLEYEVASIKEQENGKPRESVFVAGSLKSNRVLYNVNSTVYVAGSYIKNSYPVDSGEGAARSAFDVVERIRKEHHLATRG